MAQAWARMEDCSRLEMKKNHTDSEIGRAVMVIPECGAAGAAGRSVTG
jgi:hypothetical protein